MAASDIVLNVVFYVFAAAAIAGAAGVAASRNIVRSAFALLAVLFSAAALYAVMKADFLAAAQVLIYVGGILVLIIFAVMLTHRITDVNVSNESTPGPAAVFAVLCLFVALGVTVLFAAKWPRGPEPRPAVAGGTDVLLLQYQADGKTGLGWGKGATHEDRAVLVVRVPRAPEGVEEVEFQVSAVPGWRGDWVRRRIAGGEARLELSKLPSDDPATPKVRENRLHWRVKLRDREGASRPDDPFDEQVDFTVYRGVTEPAARALAGPFLFAFEIASVLLLAALVGAAFLARKEVKEA